MRIKILILSLFVSINVNAKDYFNISYLSKIQWPANYTASEHYDLIFRSKLLKYNERFELSYEFCPSGCYSLGAAYSLQKNIISKYEEANLTSYVSFKTQSQFYYITTKYSQLLSDSSEAGAFINVGQETIDINPNGGIATDSTVDRYLRYEFGAFVRFGLPLSVLKMQRIYFESGVNLSAKNNSDIVLNGEKISAGSLEKQRILLILGIGLSF